MYVLVFPRITCLHLMNRLNSLKHVQHFDVHNSNQKKGIDKKKQENIQFTILWNTCIIMKHFEN